jgi:hypothetical protein
MNMHYVETKGRDVMGWLSWLFLTNDRSRQIKEQEKTPLHGRF